jgi:hypothetical protein
VPRGPKRQGQASNTPAPNSRSSKPTQVTKPQTVSGREPHHGNEKSLKGQANTSTTLLGQSAAPTWRSGPQSKQATRLTGELISLTRTWFSVTPLQASMALVAWILLHPRVAVEIFCAARPRPGRLFDLSGSACSEVPAWELTPGWMAR